MPFIIGFLINIIIIIVMIIISVQCTQIESLDAFFKDIQFSAVPKM